MRISEASSRRVRPDESMSLAPISDITRPGLPKTRILSANSAASVTECVMKTVVFFFPIKFNRSFHTEATVISPNAENTLHPTARDAALGLACPSALAPIKVSTHPMATKPLIVSKAGSL
jgi:hypothetical protein